MVNKMKYNINDKIELKPASLSYGTITKYDEESRMYSIQLTSGSKIKCTEGYIKGPAGTDEDG